jgi:Fuc2NAc and GlcNAc transferase
MDGIDGLAGTEAVFVSAIAGGILFYAGFYAMAYICFSLTLSVLGFLIFNWPPAKIFMGDVGSGFLGFVFADLMWITHNHHQLSFSVWFILLSIFVVDASCTLIYRIIQKKNWWAAHREHAYQRLVQAGFSHKKITLSVLGVNLLICFSVVTIYFHFNSNVVFAFLMLMLSAFWVMWFFIIWKYQAV